MFFLEVFLGFLGQKCDKQNPEIFEAQEKEQKTNTHLKKK
jgi:hypothetical protein